jgi:hypothetical protein
MAVTPVFRVNVISRTARAVNYQHRGGATKVDFAGTDLMPKPMAKRKSKARRIHRNRSGIRQLDKPTVFGNEYLTYILWAISPEGRAQIWVKYW